ncbi:hypothetical protein ACLK14_19125 [Escherichia coli]
MSGLRCRNSLLFILLMLGFVAGYQAYLYKQLNPGVGVRENIDTWAWRPDKLNNQLTPLRGKPEFSSRKTGRDLMAQRRRTPFMPLPFMH